MADCVSSLIGEEIRGVLAESLEREPIEGGCR